MIEGMQKLIDSTIRQLESNAAKAEERRIEEAKKKQYDLLKSSLLDIAPFSERESTPEATRRRLKKARDNFEYFDKVYFPPEFYGDDYSKPGVFHKKICGIADKRDKKVHLICGPRDHSKTAMLQKKVLHMFLFGHRKYMGIGSETLETPEYYLADLIYYLTYNERLTHDFVLEWHECSTKKMFATSEQNPKGTFMQTLSEEKSARGKTRLQRRFDFVLLTDFENYTTSLTKDARRKRRDRLNEIRGSLSKKGVVVWEANNFDADTLSNELLEEQEKGLGSEAVVVHIYPAWDDNRPYTQRALWPARFPAKSEEELKKMLGVEDEYDWAGNMQQRPKRRSGEQFPAEYYQEWTELPEDLQSVIFVDPNCSEKGKGDTTGMPNLAFSPTTQQYYVTAARCRSYFLSNDLLLDALTLYQDEARKGISIIALGMDGNVTQESSWKNNIHNFVQINGYPYPPVQFRKYSVDTLVTGISSIYKERKLYFPPGFSNTEEGKEAVKQLFSFRTKKEKKKDDFPDALISAFALLIELGIAMILGNNSARSVSVNNYRVKRGAI